MPGSVITLDDILNDPEDYKVWDNQPGGKIVKRWQKDNVKYVGVEFDNSPGVIYTYLAGE